MSNYLDLFIITGATVGKIMLCSVAGMYASRYFVEREKSEKGLSYISVRILLPCLLFSNLCLSVTWESVSKFYWAPLLACLPLGLGLASSFVFRLILPERYHALIMLGCTFQNGLTFPLSLILNLKGVPWLDAQAVGDAQSHIFLYNIVCSIGLWAVGEPIIAAASEKAAAELSLRQEEQQRARERREDADKGVGDGTNKSFAFPFQEAEMAARVQENYPHGWRPKRHARDRSSESNDDDNDSDNSNEVEHPTRSATKERRKRGASALEQLSWYKPAKGHDKPIQPPKPARVYTDDYGAVIVVEPDEEDEERGGKSRCSLKRVSGIAARSFTSPTVFFSLVAIFISLTPPLRWLAASLFGQVLIGGLTVVGSGAIPLQLLVLGCTIAANRPNGDDPREEGGNTSTCDGGTSEGGSDGAAAAEVAADARPLAHMTSCITPFALFVVCSVGLRMFILPALCFLVIHLLIISGVMPSERSFVIAMLVATSSPAAINSAVICSMHNYHAREYARMIFVMYITAILSTAIWLFLSILYLGSV